MAEPTPFTQQVQLIREAKDAGPNPARAKRDAQGRVRRNLVVCCDGTGNEFGGHLTNVLRLYGYLTKDETQLTYYDPGVGTLSPPGWKTKVAQRFYEYFGLAFGYGIRENIEEAYKFLMDNFRPGTAEDRDSGDRVFIFGFSRGAYTARALAGMIHRCGLLPKGNDNLIRYVTKMYENPNEDLQKAFKTMFTRRNECEPHFVGVWDTVSSVSFFWPTMFASTNLNPDVKHGRHALALDERRSLFEPVLWDEPPAGSDQVIKQRWFTGVHSDVGGGYEEHALADVTLRWMLREATQQDLAVNGDWETDLDRPPQHGDPHDSLRPRPWWRIHRGPYWWLLPYRRREIRKEPVPDLDDSVRTRHTADGAFSSYVSSITRPRGWWERNRGGIPGFVVLAVGGFLVPLLWALTCNVAAAVGDAARLATDAVPTMPWYGKGVVGAAVAVLAWAVVWTIRFRKTRN